MNTLHNSLTIAAFISGLSVDFVGTQNTAAGPAVSRHPADPLQSRYLRFSRFTAHEGLSSDQTRNVIQDKRGFMWFATLDGLNRYDSAGAIVYHYNS